MTRHFGLGASTLFLSCTKQKLSACDDASSSAGSSKHNSGPSCLLFVFLLVLLHLAISGCSIKVTHYTDGSFTQYLTKPIPILKKPIARTLSVENIVYNTAGNMKGRMISDLVAREIYFLPPEVGHEVKKQLDLDNKFSKKATYTALNTIARNRANARHMRGNKKPKVLPSTNTASTSTQQYVRRQENMAKEAYRKGDYLGGDIHNSAAMNTLMIDQSFARAQASADMTFSLLNSMAAAGEALIKSEFIKLRNWIEFKSGAIGKRAPKGNHLSVIFLLFTDGKRFHIDSRNRVAVLTVLTNKKGISTSVLEGSDILNCVGECGLFKPKATAKLMDKTTSSADVQKLLRIPEGTQYLTDNGFDYLNGIYQYTLLRHGLQKLSKSLK